MPDTPATRAIVTAAYDRYLREKLNFENRVAHTTQVDVKVAREKLQAALKLWFEPGPGELPKIAKADRKAKKSWWSKFKM